ncbi:MAG: Mov34/MPN/PAD-1 family protein [Promethearchaeota archaeon]
MPEEKKFKLIVKPLAYVKMVMHTLRFGSPDLPKNMWKEIMGTCVGKVEEGNPVVYDAIPMAHGRRIEVEWSEEQYIAQSDIDQEISEKGYFVVSWYHSHPGMGTFLSAADKRNHLYFQQVNPQATALVFDHNLLEDNGRGFDAFRLTKVDAGINSDFEPVEIEVENFELIQPLCAEVWEMIHRIHRKDPIMPEVGETADIFEAFNVETTEEIEETYIDVELARKTLGEALAKVGMPPEVTGELLPRFVENLNDWTKSTTTKVHNNTALTLTVLRNMKNSLSDGLQRLQNWFKKTLRDQIADLSLDISMMEDAVKKLASGDAGEGDGGQGA